MALVFIASTAPYGLFLAFGSLTQSAYALSLCVAYGLGPVLSSRGHLVAGRALPLTAAALGLYGLASVIGSEAQVQLAAFMLTGWAYNLFDSRRHALPLVLLSVGPGVLFGLIELDVLLPVDRGGHLGTIATVVAPVTIGISYLLFAVVMFHFYRVNQGNEDDLAEAVIRLDAENRARLLALEEAEEARARAEMADAAKSQFLAVMSHELRTPLHAIMGALELIGQDTLTNDQHTLANMGREGSRDLLALIHNVIDFASLDDGEVALSVSRFSLLELLQGAAERARTLVDGKSIEVIANVDASVPVHARGDRERLRQVLSNLLSNAAKFTERGYIAVRAKATHDAGRGLTLHVEVEDTGIGVPEEFREAIFERFVQADGGLDRSYEGTGLGLSICQAVVEAMNGHIEMSPRVGGGSIFRFSVALQQAVAAESGVVALAEGFADELDPQAESPAAPSQTASEGSTPVHTDVRQTHHRATVPDRPPSVLIAEDNPVNQMIIKSMVKKLGFTDMKMCDNGQAAADAFEGRAFDLVLLDVQMPVMDGIAAARAIRAHEASNADGKTPMVAISANVLAEHIQLGLDSGFDRYLSKPLELDTLRDALAELNALPGQADAGKESSRSVQRPGA